jgi:hypothetical protein
MRELREPIPITEPKLLVVEGHTAEVFFTAFLTEMDLANTQVIKPSDIDEVGELRGFLRALRAVIVFAQKMDLDEVAHNAEEDSYQSLRTALRSFSDQVGLADMQIQDFGGINELPGFLRALRITPGFAGVTSLGIIRDAEENPANAFQSVCSALRNAQFDVPGQPEVFVGTKPQVGVLILPDAMTSGMLETLCLRSVAGDPAIPCVEKYFECIRQRVPEEGLPKTMDKARVQAFLASRLDPEMHLGRAAQKRYWPWDSPVFGHVRKFLSDL